MDPERTERFMQFVTEHMARFAAGMEDLRQRQDSLEARQEAFQAQQEAFQAEMMGTNRHLREVDARLETITAIQHTQAGMLTNLGLQVGQLAAKIDRLADIEQHTDERLNIVISQVDDLIRRLGDQRRPL